ncbi:MAG: tripartite tricarboxylate transporter TctB family protein [Devosia sp.]|uniref:tripartite tricarboxylate transporter TctB family protein n=1 Tax=Devosia sp. TaxID=1871048 RepID=UPI0026016F10|nr:tripartite tricarboxylate transporter TctB family protein [Devosia sp.]MDB5540450.1 tripartite tricarboxylate transporter TctB family protein [Devosia sp.]
MTRDIALGVIALVFSVFYVTEASKISRSALGDAVGAGGVPMTLGWIMGGAAILLIAHQLWMRRAGPLIEAKVTEAFETPGRTALVAGGVVLIAALYIAAVRWLGYLPSTALLLAAMFLYQRVPLTWRTAVVAIAGSFALWLLFDAFLGINLPNGLLSGLI